MRRFGVELPYEEQLTWGLTRLRPEQLELCIKESHSDERILAGVPYAGAVETVRDWREQGHVVHVASYREPDCQQATAAWLQRHRTALRRPAVLLARRSSCASSGASTCSSTTAR